MSNPSGPPTFERRGSRDRVKWIPRQETPSQSRSRSPQPPSRSKSVKTTKFFHFEKFDSYRKELRKITKKQNSGKKHFSPTQRVDQVWWCKKYHQICFFFFFWKRFCKHKSKLKIFFCFFRF